MKKILFWFSGIFLFGISAIITLYYVEIGRIDRLTIERTYPEINSATVFPIRLETIGGDYIEIDSILPASPSELEFKSNATVSVKLRYRLVSVNKAMVFTRPVLDRKTYRGSYYADGCPELEKGAGEITQNFSLTEAGELKEIIVSMEAFDIVSIAAYVLRKNPIYLIRMRLPVKIEWQIPGAREIPVE